MDRDLALIEDDASLGIDAGGQISGGHLAGVSTQQGRVLPDGDGVQVDDAVDALVLVLQRNEVSDRTQVVAQVQVAGRLNAGKNPLHVKLLFLAVA